MFVLVGVTSPDQSDRQTLLLFSPIAPSHASERVGMAGRRFSGIRVRRTPKTPVTQS
jgi:hypothetical protein